MDVKDIQKIIDNNHYWDARVLNFECRNFSDEVELSYDDEGITVNYIFKSCYKVVIDHVKEYDKQLPVKQMVIAQIPYFLQDVEVGEKNINNIRFYTCKIDMFPLYIEIWCKDIHILKC